MNQNPTNIDTENCPYFTQHTCTYIPYSWPRTPMTHILYLGHPVQQSKAHGPKGSGLG